MATVDSMDRRGSESSNNSNGKEAMGRWLTRLKDWVVTSEPSTLAFRQHKKHVFQTAGVSRNDPDASMKLRYIFLSFFLFPHLFVLQFLGNLLYLVIVGTNTLQCSSQQNTS